MFCIITPVFEDAFRATKLLIKDLKKQTCQDFKHILISNGVSKEFTNLVRDNDRLVHIEFDFEPTPDIFKLLVNLGKRRNYCLKHFDADRFFFFDADLLVTDSTFFEQIAEVHDKADIILSKTIVSGHIFPEHPIQKCKIDISNYSFSNKIAKKYDYPTDCTDDIANDWRFYERIKSESHYELDLVYAKKDGRSMYENLSKVYQRRLNESMFNKLHTYRNDTNKIK